MELLLPAHLEHKAIIYMKEVDYLNAQLKHWESDLNDCFKHNDFTDFELIRSHINKRLAERSKIESLLNEVLDVIPGHKLLQLFQ